MEQFSVYGHALVAMAIFAVMCQGLALASALRKNQAGLPTGATPEPDYTDPTYRLSRAYLNAVENSGVFFAVTVSAMLAGANPFMVNLLASVFLLSRVAMAIVHIGGLGRKDFGLRSIAFTIGWLCSFALGGIAVFEVLT